MYIVVRKGKWRYAAFNLRVEVTAGRTSYSNHCLKSNALAGAYVYIYIVYHIRNCILNKEVIRNICKMLAICRRFILNFCMLARYQFDLLWLRLYY